MAKKRRSGSLLVVVVLLALTAGAFWLYRNYVGPPVKLKNKNYTYFYIGKNDTFETVMENLQNEDIIKESEVTTWLAEKMELSSNLHPGRYRITNGMNVRQVINLLKYNKQEKVKLSFNSQIHNLEEFVKYCDDKLELSDDELMDLVLDEKLLHERFGLDPGNCFAMLVPGTVEMSWAVELPAFVKMLEERYKKVWTPERKSRARKLGYTPAEITTIASIVQSESGITSEQEKIAGVYFNRLKKNMPLQADPTLKFANGNFKALRVLDIDKEIDSPYNTYKYRGIPPGPICLVATSAIDATLNYTKHAYFYFCAKPELNGYSDFSKTYEEHRRYAAAYQKAMDKIGISR